MFADRTAANALSFIKLINTNSKIEQSFSIAAQK
jgi:hypothetical protein